MMPEDGFWAGSMCWESRAGGGKRAGEGFGEQAREFFERVVCDGLGRGSCGR